MKDYKNCIHMKIYEQEVSFCSDDMAEMQYIRDFYQAWVLPECESRIYNGYKIISTINCAEFLCLNRLSYKDFTIFRCCRGQICRLQETLVIRCVELFENYCLKVFVKEQKIEIIKNCHEFSFRERRFVSHIIDELIATISYTKGYYKLHAGACVVDGKGIALVGDKGAGKTTLLIDLLFNGARYMNNDVTRLYNKNGKAFIYAWPSKINIGKGTVCANRLFQKNIQEHVEEFGCITINPDDGKIEVQCKDFIRLCGTGFALKSSLDLVVRPHFSLQQKKNEVQECGYLPLKKLLSSIDNSWLPIVAQSELQKQTEKGLLLQEKVRVIDFYYGIQETEPAKFLIEYIRG